MQWDGYYSDYNLHIIGVTVIQLNPSPYGISDYVTINGGTTPVNLGANYGYSATFTSVYNNSHPQYYDWYLQLKKTDGDYYTVAYQRNISTALGNGWNGTMPSQLPNYSWVRNDNGNIQGRAFVDVLDNTNYEHTDGFDIEVPYGPPTPQIVGGYYQNGELYLSYYTCGATQYKLYYGLNPGPPYLGTGATQGASPVNTGSLTTSPLGGFNTCVPYYLSVKGLNTQGESGYANEKKVMVYVPSNNNGMIKYHFGDEDMADNATWNDDHYFLGNLIVESGAVLTIQGGKLYFDENSKIIILPGGKLILDGATCTNSCSNHWQGIEVWGNYYQHQYTISGSCAQGTLVLKNGAVIENANNAVALWHPGDYYSSGGIVTASNAIFKNNRRDAEFISYHNHHPINGQPTNYNSNFTNCQFITDNTYINPNPFYSFITMWDVEGIGITGCTFQNLKPLSTSSARGYGIYTENASYSIRSSCSSNSTPCPEASIIHTKFQGLFAGIAALNGGTYIKTISVYDAKFIDNGYGVKLNGVSNAIIIKNEFQIGPNNICPNMTGIGVELNSCNGYCVEENAFTYSTFWPAGDNFIGIHVYYDPTIPSVLNNELYKNSFVGLSIAIQADGKNNGNNNNPNDGLHYYCNTNQNNINDFYVTGVGIAQNQGTSALPAGNTFSRFAFPLYSDFNDQATWPIIYTHQRGQSMQNPKNIYHVYKDSTYNTNPCLSHQGGGGSQTSKLTQEQITAIEQDFANKTVAYNNVNAIFQGLKDGGSSEETMLSIQTSFVSNTMDLRNKLLGESPHLSEDVLKAASERNDVLPDPILFEILAANPDELRNEELLTYLSKRTPPLPDYMIDLLRELSTDSSYKTALLREMSELNEAKTRDAYAIIRDLVHDSTTDMNMLRNWLDNLHNINADYLIIDSWLQEGNVTSACALVDLLPQIYSIDDAAMIEYNYYKDLKILQAELITQNKNIFQLDSTQIQILENIATNSQGIAGTQSQSILAFAYGNSFINCPLPMSAPNTKSSSSKKNVLINQIFQPQVTSYPNPAEKWVVFNYSLPSGANNCSLEVINLTGQIVEAFKISNDRGMIVWDIRNIKEGNYIYILKNDKYSKSGKITIIH